MFQRLLLSTCCWKISYLQAWLKKHLTITILLILLSALLKPLPWSKLPPSSFQLNTPAEQKSQTSAFSPGPAAHIVGTWYSLGTGQVHFGVFSFEHFSCSQVKQQWVLLLKRILTFCGFSPNSLSNLGRCWSCPRTWCRTGGGWCPCSSCSTTWGRWPHCRGARERRGSEWKPLCHSRPPFWAKVSSVKPNFLTHCWATGQGAAPVKTNLGKDFWDQAVFLFYSRPLKYW